MDTTHLIRLCLQSTKNLEDPTDARCEHPDLRSFREEEIIGGMMYIEMRHLARPTRPIEGNAMYLLPHLWIITDEGRAFLRAMEMPRKSA